MDAFPIDLNNDVTLFKTRLIRSATQFHEDYDDAFRVLDSQALSDFRSDLLNRQPQVVLLLCGNVDLLIL